MNRVFLLDVAPLVAERPSRWHGNRLYVSTGSVEKGDITADEWISYEGRPSRADLVARPSDVIMARMARTDKVLTVDETLAQGVFSTGFLVLRPDPTYLIPSYLKWWLRRPETQALRDSASTGSTQRAVTNAGMASMQIDLPPTDEQQRIATILDKAAAGQRQRRRILAQLDSIPSAAFAAEFGSSALPNYSIPIRQIADVARVTTGNTPSRASEEYYGDSIEWIKSDNLGGTVATAASEGLSERGRVRARVAPAGSILVTCIAGSPLSIGKCSLVDRPVAFNQQINAILPSVEINSVFLLHQLKADPGLVRRKSTGGMKGLVSKSAFEGIEVLVPPLDQQQEFAKNVAAIDTQRARAQRAIDLHDELFASLQSRAFKGEL